MSAQRVRMGWGRIAITGLSVLQIAGCGFSIASPEGTASLNVEGTVRDAVTGSPIVDAKVALIRFSSGWPELKSVRTGSDGRYVLTYQVKHIVTEDEFAGGCDIWHDDLTTSLGIQATANGYALWASDGSDGTPSLRCIDAPQTLNFQLRK